MIIAFFASSLVSSYRNGAAAYYRGLARALHQRGHGIIFYEPDAFERQTHRDMADPDWAEVVVYPATRDAVYAMLETARAADIVVKASGVGVFDELLEREVLNLQDESTIVVFWDVDAPATLERVVDNPADPFRALIPQYDLIFTGGGGQPVVDAYRALRAQDCVPVYNALDPQTHHPVPADPAFSDMLGFLGNRLPDHEARVDEFFFKAARRLPAEQFLLGGSGWQDNAPELANVRYLGHVSVRDHNVFNSSPLTILNVSRQSMAGTGCSPPPRIFEAAGSGACLITDAWQGIELFLEPGREVLIARDGDHVVEHLLRLTPTHARILGDAARKRLLAGHTYAQRAAQVESVLLAGTAVALAS